MKIAAQINPQVAAAAGHNQAGWVVADIDIGAFTSAQREVIFAGQRQRPSGCPLTQAEIDAGGIFMVAAYDLPALDAAALRDWAESVLTERQAKAEAEAKAERALRERLEKVGNAPAHWFDLCANHHLWDVDGGFIVGDYWDATPTHAVKAETGYEGAAYPKWLRYLLDPQREAANAVLLDAARERNAERVVREEKAAAEKRAKKEAVAAERAAWIRAHGSARLKRCLEEGIECGGAYRDERLAAERPGFEWDTDGENKDPRNPPEAAFAGLDEARNVAPDAKLVYLVVDEETDDETGEVTGEGWRGYAAASDFLGSGIIKLICAAGGNADD